MEYNSELSSIQLRYDLLSPKSFIGMMYHTGNKMRNAAVKNITIKHNDSNDQQINNS